MCEKLIAGIVDDDLEIFKVNDTLQFIRKDRLVNLTDSIDAMARVRNVIESDPDAIEGLTLLGITNPVDEIVKYAECNYPNLDDVADITSEGISVREYKNCPERGKCKAEGLLCKVPGALTKKEVEVAVLTAKGLANKQVAHRLGISKLTVDVHLRNVYQKIRCHSRAALVLYVLKNFKSLWE